MKNCRSSANQHAPGPGLGRSRKLLALLTATVTLNLDKTVSAQDLTDSASQATTADESSSRFNLPTPTFGGRQLWGDVAWFRGWRIQHNVLSDHYRLLSPTDVRHAWGAKEECRAALERIQRDQALAPLSGRAVVVIHGIIRSSKSFARLRTELENQDVMVIGFDYPSTQVSIEQSAEYLGQLLNSLDGVDQIDLVVHSMGGLVVRTWLKDNQDPRLRRMVMLGVPNLGAKMANIVQQNPLFRFIYGPAGQQLVEDPEGFISGLPTPDFEFAVISGARGLDTGWNPLIPGDDDGTVSVDNTRLPGARDFMTVPVLHSFLMSDDRVIESTCRFLETGCLHKDGECEPIPDVRHQPEAPARQ